VLHFDEGEHVRLIGWKVGVVAGRPVTPEQVEVTVTAAEFYGILAEWRQAIRSQWDRASKR
jgi:hypothetical protein